MPAWDLPGIIAAYEPVNAANLAASYVNLANPGTYDAAPSATPPTLSDGWVFPNNLACYLDTGIAADAGWSMVVEFQMNVVVTFGASMAGAVTTDGSSGVFSIYQVYINESFGNRNYTSGGSVSIPAPVFSGVMAISGQQGYLDGVVDGGTIPSPLPMTTKPIYIGCTNGASGATNPWPGTIKRLYIYNRALTAGEIVAIIEGMPAVAWTSYAVGDGHDVANDDLTALSPQPASAGLKVTRRTHDVGAPLIDEFRYVELAYSALGSVAEYQAVLTAFGLLSALQNEITITVRDATLGWVRFNGTAVRPEMSADVQWSRYFPRDVVVLIKFLEIAS